MVSWLTRRTPLSERYYSIQPSVFMINHFATQNYGGCGWMKKGSELLSRKPSIWRLNGPTQDPKSSRISDAHVPRMSVLDIKLQSSFLLSRSELFSKIEYRSASL
jgi:hypothetical protein